MKKNMLALLILFLPFFIGCEGSPAQTGWEARKNRKAMVGLTLGITKADVLKIMGKPRKTEAYTVKENDIELWLYLTEAMVYVRDTNFTPLVFENDKLVGWGWSFLDTNVEKYELRIR